MTTQELQHLYWRAGFGISPPKLDELKGKSREAIVKDLFKASETVQSLNIDTSEFDQLQGFKPNIGKKQLQVLLENSRKKIRQYNLLWLGRMCDSDAVLRERMTLFWTNHFVCRDNNMLFVKQYQNLLRTHALGDFKAFVKAVSKSAAMLKYLNNKQNKKRSPNENFARELMELFTLGKGHYSEEDIKESARAFTGYFHDLQGEFFLRPRQHDYGQKTFFGQRGNFDGDDIIDIILSQKQCARFICEKVYRYFVNPSVNATHIEQMTEVFYPDYNIKRLMEYVFLSDWFYDAEHIGVKIKSPVELLVGLRKTVPYTFKKEQSALAIQKLLGQALLNPPNVAGWQGDKTWIDSNTIFMRLRLPSLLLSETHISTKEKGDFNDVLSQFIKRKKGEKQPFKTKVDWQLFDENFKDINISDLEDYVLQTTIHPRTKSYLETLGSLSKREACIQLMSLPEYQMC
jgi:uncharacterized protein (DUF1800 family)